MPYVFLHISNSTIQHIVNNVYCTISIIIENFGTREGDKLMKKKFCLCLLITILLLLFLSFFKFNTYLNAVKLNNEIEKYNNYISNFVKLDVKDIYSKISNNEVFLLYTGRDTCPWCRKLAPILYEFSLKEKINIYYLDSKNTDKDFELKYFRESYDIEFVPSIIFYNKNNTHNKIEFDITLKNFDVESLKKSIQSYVNQ